MQHTDRPPRGISPYGSYDTIGRGFQALYKQFGRIITDKPYAFYYDMEYKENDAKMEAVVALKEEAEAEGFDCRSLAIHKAVKTIHRGEYWATRRNIYQVV